MARRSHIVLALTAALVVLCTSRIARLGLDTSFTELLPKSDPAVVVLEEIDRRMPALSSLYVVVEGPHADANRRAVAMLAARLRALGDPLIDDVVRGVEDEDAFFRAHRWLYATSTQLEDARAQLDEAIARSKNPFYVDLSDDDSDGDGLARVERKWSRPMPGLAKFPNDDFAYPDGTTYAVVVWLRSSVLRSSSTDGVVLRIRAVMREVAREVNDPALSIGVTGNAITAAEERHALATDISIASGITSVLVCLVVFWYFGRARAVPYMLVPALVGVAVALACAQIAFGHLNIVTGFMGAIIVGNGINYAIVQMARYEEERARGTPGPIAIEVALTATWRATGLAALGAMIAYGSLALTDFRGFNQFGYIGAIGMLSSWVATVVVLPAMWRVFDHAPRATTRVRGLTVLEPVARFVVRWPRALLAIGAALSLLALVPLWSYAKDPFEYDFGKLRNQVSKHSDSERLSTALNPIFGRSLSPGFVLAERPEQAAELKALITSRDHEHLMGSVHVLDDFLPGSREEQDAKLVILGDIRHTIDRNLPLVDDARRERLRALRPPDDLRVIAANELPRSLRRFYTENDGALGRIVTYVPRDDLRIWDGRVQLRLAAIVRDLRLADGTQVRSSGSAVLFASMLDAIIHDGPRVSLASFIGVLLLVIVVAARRGAPYIMIPVLVGVLWMAGAMAALHVRLNFLNFIALPITFGISVDYAANVYLRYRQPGNSLEHVVAAAGSAVALCSLTTIIGYGALLVADTAALRTFGMAAILGEVACVVAAVVLLPAFLTRHARRPETGHGLVET